MKSTRRLYPVAVCSTLLCLLTSCSTYLSHSIDTPWQPDESLGVNTLYMGFRADLTYFSHAPEAEDYPAFFALLPYVFIDLPISLVADTLLLPGWTYDEFIRHRLHKAAARGDLKGIRYQLDHGADVNEPGVWGHTPLMMAAWSGQSAVVSYLISQGANPNLFARKDIETSANGLRSTAYDYAAHQGHCDIANFLWERMHRSARPIGHRSEACKREHHVHHRAKTAGGERE